MKRFVLFLLAATTLLCVGCKKENNKKITLHLFHYKQEIVNEMEEMAAAFHNLYPNITIETETIPNDAQTVLKTRLFGGEAPDIMMLQSYSTIFEYAQEGFLADLTNEAFMENIVNAAKKSVTYKGLGGEDVFTGVDALSDQCRSAGRGDHEHDGVDFRIPQKFFNVITGGNTVFFGVSVSFFRDPVANFDDLNILLIFGVVENLSLCKTRSEAESDQPQTERGRKRGIHLSFLSSLKSSTWACACADLFFSLKLNCGAKMQGLFVVKTNSNSCHPGLRHALT